MIPFRDNVALERRPFVTIALAAISVLAYLLEIRHGGSLLAGPAPLTVLRHAPIPHSLTHPSARCELLPSAKRGLAPQVRCAQHPGPSGSIPIHQGPAWRAALASLFVYGSFAHLISNLACLAIFAPTLESALGHARCAALYVCGGLLAIATEVALAPDATAPALAASGAVAALVGAYALLYPRAQVLCLVPVVLIVTIVAVPALALLALWLAVQLYIVLAGLASPVSGGDAAACLALVPTVALGALAARLHTRRGNPDGVLA